MVWLAFEAFTIRIMFKQISFIINRSILSDNPVVLDRFSFKSDVCEALYHCDRSKFVEKKFFQLKFLVELYMFFFRFSQNQIRGCFTLDIFPREHTICCVTFYCFKSLFGQAHMVRSNDHQLSRQRYGFKLLLLLLLRLPRLIVSTA